MSLPDIDRLQQADCAGPAEPFGMPASVAPSQAQGGTHAGGLAQVVRDIAAGRLDPVARVQAALEAIAAGESLNAMRHVNAEAALAQAAVLRDRVRRGEPVGRLAGVLVAVKDCFAVAGLPSTHGTRALPVEVAVRSAECVERLQREDAIVIGMTTMHELAYGATTDNPHVGRVRHPLAPDRLAGGSSGGSAVAVAGGMADVGLGTDTAGSVRMPAALCGLSGYKPTFGLVPLHGVLPLSWTLDHVGILTRSAADAALVVEVMAGLEDGVLAAEAGPSFRAVAPTNYFPEHLDAGVRALYRQALQVLRQDGIEVDEVAVPELELAPTLQYFTISVEAAQVHADRALLAADGIGEEVRVRLESGRFVRAVDYVKAQRLRSTLHDTLAASLAGGAIMVTPAVIIPAPLPGTAVDVEGVTLPIHPALTRCTLPFNLTGMPAISVPCGTTRSGLPVGLQLAAARGNDAQLLAIAGRVERLLAGAQRRSALTPP